MKRNFKLEEKRRKKMAQTFNSPILKEIIDNLEGHRFNKETYPVLRQCRCKNCLGLKRKALLEKEELKNIKDFQFEY